MPIEKNDDALIGKPGIESPAEPPKAVLVKFRMQLGRGAAAMVLIDCSKFPDPEKVKRLLTEANGCEPVSFDVVATDFGIGDYLDEHTSGRKGSVPGSASAAVQ